MLIGAMNHPAREILEEIRWIADLGFDFIDLTLEPPLAAADQIKTRDVRARLDDLGLGVVGHTAYYLPIGSPFETVRRGAVEELKRCAEVFAALGAKWMNVHPDRQAPFHSRATVVELNLRTIREVARFATDLGLGLMVENVPGWFNSAREMGELINAVEGLGFHLDIGHANLQNDHNTTEEMLEAFGRRLRHVHLHDNKGGAHDLHLPLGAGNLDAPGCIRMLQDHGYDGTITLEVFTTDKLLLAYSRKVLKDLWDKCRELEKV